MPRSSGAGGFTLFTPSEERLESGMYSKSYLESQLAVALGVGAWPRRSDTTDLTPTYFPNIWQVGAWPRRSASARTA